MIAFWIAIVTTNVHMAVYALTFKDYGKVDIPVLLLNTLSRLRRHVHVAILFQSFINMEMAPSPLSN